MIVLLKEKMILSLLLLEIVVSFSSTRLIVFVLLVGEDSASGCSHKN